MLTREGSIELHIHVGLEERKSSHKGQRSPTEMVGTSKGGNLSIPGRATSFLETIQLLAFIDRAPPTQRTYTDYRRQLTGHANCSRPLSMNTSNRRKRHISSNCMPYRTVHPETNCSWLHNLTTEERGIEVRAGTPFPRDMVTLISGPEGRESYFMWEASNKIN